MNRKILNIVNRVLFEGSDKMCSECGGGMMEGECKECGMKEGEIKEKLHGRQYKLDKNKNGRIDRSDFAMLRRKKSEMKENEEYMCECGGGMMEGQCMECGMKESEIKEKLHGRQYKLDGNKNGRLDSEDFKMLRKENYELVIETGERFVFTENEMINIIENIVLEEKSKKNKGTKLPNITKSSQEKSKKENDSYINSVVKKMKDYLKGGSKGEYEMKPKSFPKGNGEFEKMKKMAYTPSDTAQEYIDNFTAAGLENLDYDEIHPNDEWVTMNLVGNSRTGNNPEWGNAVETGVGEKRNKIRKNNLLAKVKRKAYQKDDQPVKIDSSGADFGDTVDDLLKKYGTKKSETKKLKKESKETVENNLLNEDLNKMKKLFEYGKKTQ
jgi:hypothetical protein